MTSLGEGYADEAATHPVEVAFIMDSVLRCNDFADMFMCIDGHVDSALRT